MGIDLYLPDQSGLGLCRTVRESPELAGTPIRVRSIVGPFLEHSRIFRFGSDARGPRYFIGSADLMTRNLDGRIEVMVPVASPPLAARIEEILALCLADDELAWELDAERSWRRVPRDRGIAVQEELARRATEPSRPEPDAG